MTLSTRLAIAMVSMVLLTAAAVGLLAYQGIAQSVMPGVLARLEARARIHSDDLQANLQFARADILMTAGTSSLKGFLDAGANDGINPEDKTPIALWRRRLQQNFVSELTAKPQYALFRVVDRDGHELVRVDRLGPNGAIRTVPEDELTASTKRPYFQDVLNLKPGATYISQIELWRDRGAVATPHLPVIHIATAIVGSLPGTAALLFVDVDMRSALQTIAQTPLTRGQVFVVNGDGEYLVHPDPAKSFAFEFGRHARLADDFPALAAAFASQRPATLQASDSGRTRYIISLFPSRLGDRSGVTVVETQTLSAAMTTADNVGCATLMGGIAAACAAALLAVLLARSLARPLNRMASSLGAFTGKEPLRMPVSRTGEITTLAAAFNRMADTVRDKTQALQREIDERIRVEADLRAISERERLFAAAVESASDAFVITTVDGTILSWNHAAADMFGYSPEEAIGRKIEITANPEQREHQNRNLERVRRHERLVDLETVRTTSDGRLIDVSVTMSPIFGPSGEIIGISEIKRDIGRRKFHQERFRVAVEGSPGALIMADQLGRIDLMNAEAERMFGYNRSELIGQPIETLIPERFRAQHEGDRIGFSESPSRRKMGVGRDLFGLRKDGSEFAVEIGLNPITTRAGRMVMAAIVDISERKAQENLLSQRAADLERSNAELEQFAYVASHDLQEPLRMVASYAELLAERYAGKLDAKADKYIKYAVDGAKRMQRLVNDLLAYSRVGRRESPLGPIETQSLVDRVLKDLSHTVEKSGGGVDVGLLPVVVADDGQIAQVFQNLIGNALKFKAPDRAIAVRVDARRTPEGWLFSIADNGIGIEQQYSDRIFQMFQRLHDRETYDGTGIGLTISKKIIERHGGRIWFESMPGQGTTFYFTLPQFMEKAA